MRFPAISLNSRRAHAPGQSHLPLDGAHLEKGTSSRGLREEALKLWGLSLGMTLDLVTAMSGPVPLALPDQDDAMGIALGPGVVPPSLTSVFPRFSYPDVNFWIWYASMPTDVKRLLMNVPGAAGCSESDIGRLYEDGRSVS